LLKKQVQAHAITLCKEVINGFGVKMVSGGKSAGKRQADQPNKKGVYQVFALIDSVPS